VKIIFVVFYSIQFSGIIRLLRLVRVFAGKIFENYIVESFVLVIRYGGHTCSHSEHSS